MCINDKREEANIFEYHAVGTYQDSHLVVHATTELSFLFCKFIEERNNQIFAEVKGRIKLENGLVAPCIYHVNGNNKHIETFSGEINKLKKGKAIHMNIKFETHFFGSIFVYM